jgi:hypothetical protein
MNFELVILETSRIKERNLLRPANIAMNKPDTGVEIKNKSAYYVIRDCATIANDYIPHKCYSSLTDPIGQLMGKFTRDDVIDFVDRAGTQEHTQQLLSIIFTDIYKREAKDWTPPEIPEPEELEIDADADHDEIYGEYGYGDEAPVTNTVEMPVEPPIDLGDNQAVIDKLLDVFNAK